MMSANLIADTIAKRVTHHLVASIMPDIGERTRMNANRSDVNARKLKAESMATGEYVRSLSLESDLQPLRQTDSTFR